MPVCLPSRAVWVTGGRASRRFLGTPHRLRVFNLTMAALPVVSLIPILLH